MRQIWELAQRRTIAVYMVYQTRPTRNEDWRPASQRVSRHPDHIAEEYSEEGQTDCAPLLPARQPPLRRNQRRDRSDNEQTGARKCPD